MFDYCAYQNRHMKIGYFLLFLDGERFCQRRALMVRIEWGSLFNGSRMLPSASWIAVSSGLWPNALSRTIFVFSIQALMIKVDQTRSLSPASWLWWGTSKRIFWCMIFAENFSRSSGAVMDGSFTGQTLPYFHYTCRWWRSSCWISGKRLSSSESAMKTIPCSSSKKHFRK